MSEDSAIAEAVDRAIDFPLRVGEILTGIVDRKDRIGEGTIGNLSSFGEAAGVGGVGEVDVVEGIVFACGTIGVWSPSSVEREEADTKSSN
jgi:hypothetical protein